MPAPRAHFTDAVNSAYRASIERAFAVLLANLCDSALDQKTAAQRFQTAAALSDRAYDLVQAPPK